ncbi:hypothetical protein LTR94_035398, partial [Friedmanniomyces endolithicus]
GYRTGHPHRERIRRAGRGSARLRAAHRGARTRRHPVGQARGAQRPRARTAPGPRPRAGPVRDAQAERGRAGSRTGFQREAAAPIHRPL